jgi:hypothetical protein
MVAPRTGLSRTADGNSHIANVGEVNMRPPTIIAGVSLLALGLASTPLLHAEASRHVFNVKDYGATGQKTDDARQAIQRAVDVCAKAGGGTVLLPPGKYTSGTIHLRSYVRLCIDSGAVLYASTAATAFDKGALLYAEDAENITIEGRGTIDGQSAYKWQTNEEHYDSIEINRILAQARADARKERLIRPYPLPNAHPHMVLLLRCNDVRIAGLSFLHSPSWTIRPCRCQRLKIDGLYIYTSLKEAVWADGIDPDGCKDVHISNCTIETGDDAIVFYSVTDYGPALPCENITVTNCRLSSASAALKFCDGNANCVRNVTVDNCVISDSNRGIAFMVEQGGSVENVVLSNLVINCHRFDWFWWGDGDPIHFEITGRRMPGETKHSSQPGGSIRNVIIRNVIAHGEGTCEIAGHPKSWLENVSLENIRLFIATNPGSPYDKSVHAMQFQYAKNLKVKDVEVNWQKPGLEKWESALSFSDVKGLRVDGFFGGPAKYGDCPDLSGATRSGDPKMGLSPSPQSDIPAVVLDKVQDATITGCKPRPGTRVFLKVQASESKDIYVVGNELHGVKTPVQLDGRAEEGTVKVSGNF